MLGFITGFVIASSRELFVHFLGHRRERRRRLINWYAEVVAIASAEIDNSNRLWAQVHMVPPEGTPGRAAWSRICLDIFDARIRHRSRLKALAFKILMLEPDSEMRDMITELSNHIPSTLMTLRDEQEEEAERRKRYQDELAGFEHAVTTLVETIHRRHAKLLMMW
jgi:hypothetical protein